MTQRPAAISQIWDRLRLTPVILPTFEAGLGGSQLGWQVVHKTLSKNNQSKMDWRCGSSRRVPALQV
jgi:hypothetical protein